MPLDFVPMTRKVMVDGQEKTAALATLTKVVFDEKTGKSLDTLLSEIGGGSGGGLTLEKLWENEAPAAEFAAQTVPLDLSQYELFLVTTMTQIKSDGTRGELSFVAFKNVSSALQVASPGGSGPLAATRQFQILENGINFYDARSSYNNHNNQISNAFLIPHQIYGIKTSPAGATGSAITWDDIYPVGSYYYSGDAEFDPNTAFGGTWEKVAENLALRQASAEHAVGSTFGEAEHVLTVDEMPAHAHNQQKSSSSVTDNKRPLRMATDQYIPASPTYWMAGPTTTTGGGQAHNNVGPSLAVNIWHKTANGGKVIGKNGSGFSYSTEEQWTGEYWIDGKKVYQKVIITSSVSTTENTIIPIGETVSTLVRLMGIATLTNGNVIPIPYATLKNDNYESILLQSGQENIILTGNMEIAECNILIEYTKTTE